MLGVAFALVAPACGGQSVSKDGDDDGSGDGPSPPGDDDIIVGDDSGGGSGGTGSNQGGVGAGGTIVVGGAFPMGGAVPTGGTGGAVPTGGVATGGGPPTGGVAGIPATGGTMPIAGVGGTGGTGGMNTDPYCKGIRNNSPCMPEGKLCEGLLCGLADSGVRACTCATNWTCTTCDYTNSPFRDPPAMIPPCPSGVGDEVSCTETNTVCGPVGSEYCACYADPNDGLIWDCDSPPTSWTLR